MFSLVFIEVHAEKWHVYFQGPSYERFVCLKEGLKSKSLCKEAEQWQKLLQGLLHTNPKFLLPIIEVDAEKWHVYFQGPSYSYERFVCLKEGLKSKSLRKEAEQRLLKLLQGLLHTNPMFLLAIIEVDAEKWQVYFQGRSYEWFLCLKKGLDSK